MPVFSPRRNTLQYSSQAQYRDSNWCLQTSGALRGYVAPGQEKQVWGPHVRTWGRSEAISLLKKVLVTLLWLFDAPRSDSAPGVLRPSLPLVTPLADSSTNLIIAVCRKCSHIIKVSEFVVRCSEPTGLRLHFLVFFPSKFVCDASRVYFS